MSEAEKFMKTNIEALTRDETGGETILVIQIEMQNSVHYMFIVKVVL